MRFSATHEGRGGRIVCVAEAATIELAIEMVGGGHFAVHLRGARARGADGRTRPLRDEERETLRSQLRAWLDGSGRQAWAIEG